MSNLRMVFFVVVVTVVTLVGHRYLWQRLVRDPEMTPRLRQLATALIWCFGLSFLIAAPLGRRLAREDIGWLAFIAYVWFGFLATAVPFLLVVDTPGWARRLGRRFSKKPENEVAKEPLDPGRRLFMRRVSAGAVTGVSAGLVGFGMHNALGEIEVNRFGVTLERLPRALDGLKVVQLTDVHIGPLLDGRFLDGVVEKVNRERPDVVVITGDLVDGTVELIGSDVARLRDLESRWGTYFVTGNHEYYSGVEPWLRFLNGLDIECLQNRRVVIGDSGPGGATIDLAGVTDRSGANFGPAHRPDMAGALQGRDPERELILLAHRPNPIDEAAQSGVGLQLSGHTHGGQFFPITLAGPLVHPYNLGLHQHGAAQIYVSPGTGFWGPPIRSMTAAEVTSITLVSG